MKHSRTPIATGTHERPLSLWDFTRFATLLNVGVTVAMLVTAVFQGDSKIWLMVALLWPLTILVIWIVTLTIGCLVMIPVGIWRLGKRLARQGAWKASPRDDCGIGGSTVPSPCTPEPRACQKLRATDGASPTRSDVIMSRAITIGGLPIAIVIPPWKLIPSSATSRIARFLGIEGLQPDPFRQRPGQQARTDRSPPVTAIELR